jgi:hypothetical protein
MLIKVKRLFLFSFFVCGRVTYLAVEGGGGGERTMLVGSPIGNGFAPGGRESAILIGIEGTGGPIDNE